MIAPAATPALVKPQATGRLLPDTLLLIGVVAVFAAVRLHGFEPRLSGDAVYHFGFAARVLQSPSALFELDYTGRSHPLFTTALAAISYGFGANPLPLLVLVYSGHLLAVLMLRWFLTALGLERGRALTASFAFAVFSGANNLFADPMHFARTYNLALALAALALLLRGRPWPYLGLFLVSLANYEDAVFLPIAGLALMALLAQARLRREWPFHTVAIAATALYIAWMAPSASITTTIAPREIAVKVAMLPVEVASSALVFRSDVVASLWARLLLAALAAALAVWLGLRSQRSWRRDLALLAVTASFALPYLARATDGLWPSRYLYFPAAPLIALLATRVAATPRLARATLLGYLAAVGLVNGERAARVISDRHLQPLSPSARRLLTTAVAEALTRGQARVTLSAADCAFVDADLLPRTHLVIDCVPASE